MDGAVLTKSHPLTKSFIALTAAFGASTRMLLTQEHNKNYVPLSFFKGVGGVVLRKPTAYNPGGMSDDRRPTPVGDPNGNFGSEG
jgi:hypothetical protein